MPPKSSHSQIIYTGTAGWNIGKQQSYLFPADGSHLERYSQILNCVEINSSFYKNHLAKSYSRWAEVVPRQFKFSVKLSKHYTHTCGLKVIDDELKKILDDIMQLKSKFGVLLVQLPPKLSFDYNTAKKFFLFLKKQISAAIVLEPRHPTWVSAQALILLKQLDISIVYADPNLLDISIMPAQRIHYFRLHGSPQIYKSKYSEKFLANIHLQVSTLQKTSKGQSWIIFDNSTFGHATENAVQLKKNFSIEANFRQRLLEL